MKQKTTKRTGRFDMIHRRMKTLAYCAGIAVALLAASSAHADSGVGVDTAMGNALNPPGRSAQPRPVGVEDEDIMDTIRHSPTGQLYGVPLAVPETEKTASGWDYSGGIEAGVLGGAADKKNALFRQYKDLKEGAYLNYFEAEGNKPDSAHFVQFFGGGTGRDDQFYSLQFGRYNDWKVKLFYNETTHVFTDTWKSLFNGEGSGNLTTGLPSPTAVTTGSPTVGSGGCTAAAPCWSFGGKVYSNATALAAINGIIGTAGTNGLIPAGAIPTTNAFGGTNAVQSGMAKNIADKLAATSESELSLVRKKGGARLDMNITDAWKGYVSYSLEKREGSRPFGMVVANSWSTDIPEPIDYDTHDFLAGLSYADPLNQLNLRVSASMFRNNISTLNVQYPLMAAATGAGGALQTATYDLYPNNNALNLKAEYGRNLPDFYKGRFTAALAWGTNRQNDDLLSPVSPAQAAEFAAAGVTNFTGNNVGYAAGSGLISNWDTAAALSRKSADQRIDNTLVDLALNLQPVDDLNVKGKFRYWNTDNKGGYTAYNPLTGQFGRGPVDSNGAATLDTVVGLAPGAAFNTPGNCYYLGAPPNPANNGGAQCVFGLGGTITSGTNVPVFGEARSTKQINYGITADYDITRTSSVSGSVEREEFHRDFRERDKTWEDKYKVGYVNRALEGTTLRLSFEDDSRRGSDYRYRTFEDLGTGLPGLDPATILAMAQSATDPAVKAAYLTVAQTAGTWNRYSYYFRKYDQADRDQQIFNGRMNFAPREDMDMGATLQVKRVNYPDSFYGLEKNNEDTLSLDFNWQPSAERSFYAYYTYQHGKKSQDMNSGQASLTNTACTLANLQAFGPSACSDGINGPTNGQRPLSSAWTANTDDRNDVFGLGLQRDLGKVRFSADYTYSRSKTHVDYSYGGTALSNIAANQAAADLINSAAGYALPDMTFIQHVINLNLLVPVNKKLAVHLFDRYEIGKVKDWHYDNVLLNAVGAYEGGTLLLDGGPQDYKANVVGVMLQYKL
jgi:hypothetical protein